MHSSVSMTNRSQSGRVGADNKPGLVRRNVGAAKSGLMFGMLFSLFLPIIFSAGSISLPAPRLYILILFFPAVIAWLQGNSGQKRALDFLVVGFAVWMMISFLVVNGIAELELAGSIAAETVGSYLLGRWCIRNKEAFIRFVRFQLTVLICLLPAAFLEAITGDPIIIRIFQPFFQTQPVIDHEVRLGFERVQGVFQHPILYGYFAAVTFALVIYGLNLRGGFLARHFRTSVVLLSTFLSLSSGPFVGIAMQIALGVWDWLTRGFKGRWKIILIGMALAYITVDLISNRTPFHVFIQYATLNPHTAYNRILIFEYGWQNVIDNPIFGIGNNDWVRPAWMVPSVDNFWLVFAMRHGLPGLFLVSTIFVVLMVQLGRAKITDPETQSIRTGVNLSLVGTIFIGATVFLWGPVYIWLWFFIGCCMWLLEDQGNDEENIATADIKGPASRYSRFEPPKPVEKPKMGLGKRRDPRTPKRA